jgi:hypothetical protein
MYQHFPFQGPPKYTKIGIIGLKINHLATLVWTSLKFAMGQFGMAKIIWSQFNNY